ncbi:MAG: CPBP family intramembrane metalloprotease [Treponema sp.]|nr:CPBP family intramembrane metalloprotease [Treponema sp.]
MTLYIEALILYIILFFSQTGFALQSGVTSAVTANFSISAGIIRIILNYIPSIALIWFIIIKNWKIEYWIIKPGKKDLISGLFTLPALLMIGISVAFAHAFTGGAQTQHAAPPNAALWIVICVSCFLSAYLEESFFRFYILSRREELNLSAPSALIFSTILFALCHINAGPWGFLNAALSGLFLGFMFLRYNSLHGIAIAHGVYNIIAFIINSFN